uniref:Putative ovule protein n=1 Tax=Solanum chacoense TaxID=4108 RepID=A0A0V0HK71_SOLCH
MSIIDGLLFCKKYSAGTLAATDSVVSPKCDGPILPDDMKVEVKTGEKGDEPLSLVSGASSNHTNRRSFSPSWLLCTIADTRGLFPIVIFFFTKREKEASTYALGYMCEEDMKGNNHLFVD